MMCLLGGGVSESSSSNHDIYVHSPFLQHCLYPLLYLCSGIYSSNSLTLRKGKKIVTSRGQRSCSMATAKFITLGLVYPIQKWSILLVTREWMGGRGGGVQRVLQHSFLLQNIFFNWACPLHSVLVVFILIADKLYWQLFCVAFYNCLQGPVNSTLKIFLPPYHCKSLKE